MGYACKLSDSNIHNKTYTFKSNNSKDLGALHSYRYIQLGSFIGYFARAASSTQSISISTNIPLICAVSNQDIGNYGLWSCKNTSTWTKLTGHGSSLVAPSRSGNTITAGCKSGTSIMFLACLIP